MRCSTCCRVPRAGWHRAGSTDPASTRGLRLLWPVAGPASAMRIAKIREGWGTGGGSEHEGARVAAHTSHRARQEHGVILQRHGVAARAACAGRARTGGRCGKVAGRLAVAPALLPSAGRGRGTRAARPARRAGLRCAAHAGRAAALARAQRRRGRTRRAAARQALRADAAVQAGRGGGGGALPACGEPGRAAPGARLRRQRAPGRQARRRGGRRAGCGVAAVRRQRGSARRAPEHAAGERRRGAARRARVERAVRALQAWGAGAVQQRAGGGRAQPGRGRAGCGDAGRQAAACALQPRASGAGALSARARAQGRAAPAARAGRGRALRQRRPRLGDLALHAAQEGAEVRLAPPYGSGPLQAPTRLCGTRRAGSPCRRPARSPYARASAPPHRAKLWTLRVQKQLPYALLQRSRVILMYSAEVRGAATQGTPPLFQQVRCQLFHATMQVHRP